MSDKPIIVSRGEFSLKRSDFDSQEEYYWNYQYTLAQGYYIPLLRENNVWIKAKKVLDIGCGLGGFTAAFADEGAAKSVGIEICSQARIPNVGSRPNLNYMIQDITTPDAAELIGTNYDLIVVHDVIEHIPLNKKDSFLGALKQFCGNNTLILVAFPPIYSPFGLHQQAILKSIFRFVPFLSLLPLFFLKPILNIWGEDASARFKLKEIKDSRMTIRAFKRSLNRLGFSIEFEQYYLVRPTHEIRYGWRTRISKIRKIPIANEIFNSGALYLVKPA